MNLHSSYNLFTTRLASNAARAVWISCLVLGAWVALPTRTLFAAEGNKASATESDEETEVAKLPTVKIGEFLMKEFRPIEGEQVRVTMTLFAEVKEGQEKTFKAIL